MHNPLLEATAAGSSAQVPVPSGPMTARVRIAGPGGHGLFGPVTAASRARDSSLLNSTSTGPGTLAPGLHLPLLTGLWVTAHTQWGRNARQELAVKRPQALFVPAVQALNLADLESPTAVSGALAPISHSPASAWTEVASLGRVGLRKGCTVVIHPGAAFHASPVGPQATGGGALTPVSNNPACRAVVLHELLVIGGIE